MPQTLFEKIWNEHVVYQQPDGPALQPNDKETFSVLFGAKQYERR